MKSVIVRQRLVLSLVVILIFLAALAPEPVSAQSAAPAKKAMTVDDYSKWRTISSQVLSADGKWLAYVLELTNVLPGETKPETHILNLATNKDTVVSDATAPIFSPDSRWIAYQVDPGAAQRARQSRSGSGGSGNAPSGNAPRWKNNVGSETVRNLRGSLRMVDGEQGIIVTPSDFAPSAKTESQAEGKMPITLINGNQLIELLFQYQVGVKQEERIIPLIDTEYGKRSLGYLWKSQDLRKPKRLGRPK